MKAFKPEVFGHGERCDLLVLEDLLARDLAQAARLLQSVSRRVPTVADAAVESGPLQSNPGVF